jgi:hypothetical protein
MTENPGDLNQRITRTVRRLLDEFVRALGDAGPCVDAGNQIVADELFALARQIDRHGLGVLLDRLDNPIPKAPPWLIEGIVTESVEISGGSS